MTSMLKEHLLLNSMPIMLKAERFSHGVRLSGYNRDTFYRLTQFLEGLSLKEPKKLPHGGMVMELKKKYYGLTENYRELFIHRNSYPALVAYLGHKGIKEAQIDCVDIPVPSVLPAEYVVKELYVLRDYQEPIVAELADSLYSRRLDLQTGKGKTLSALAALAQMQGRCVIMVQPKFFGIWEKALEETYEGFEKGNRRVRKIEGGAQLQRLIEDGLAGDIEEDIFLVSAVTYRGYIEAYEKYGEHITTEGGYGCAPPRFHEVIGAGTQINDEIQDDPGLVFRIDIFTNVRKQIYLSATPYTGNPYVTKMIGVQLPEETMCTLPTYDMYINSVGLLYSDPTVQSKDYLTPFKNTYNHARYETQMLKAKRRTTAYYAMVKRVVDKIYVEDRLPGQKLLILCATVAFIDKLMKHMKEQYPDLAIGRFVSGDDFRTLQTNDITISTIKSAGTGQDIIDLREVLLLQATDSKKDNVQILGRLRKLKNFPGLVPRLTYMVCQHIPHHIRYHNNKKEHFEGKVLSHRTMRIV
jgi:hypothetical protein